LRVPLCLVSPSKKCLGFSTLEKMAKGDHSLNFSWISSCVTKYVSRVLFFLSCLSLCKVNEEQAENIARLILHRVGMGGGDHIRGKENKFLTFTF